MRLFMLFVLGAVVLGGIYHTQVEQYVTRVFASAEEGGGAPGVSGIQQVGRTDNGLMTRAAGALHR